jgi:hypothetical protein
MASAACGSKPAEEYFAALGDGWRLTAAQRARLAPAAETALSTGWTPAALAAFTGANTSGVRSPYADLAARLSPAELPPRPRDRRGRHGAVSATRSPGCSASTATRRACARAANRWLAPSRTAPAGTALIAYVTPDPPTSPSRASRRALRRRPSAQSGQGTAKTPKVARSTRTPGPWRPVVTVTENDRNPPALRHKPAANSGWLVLLRPAAAGQAGHLRGQHQPAAARAARQV